jgi:hypothetical protein
VIIQQCTFSPWLGIFLLVSLFLPFIASHYMGLNKFFIFVWTALVLLIFTVPAKAPQMIYIVVPFIFVIFSAVLFYVLEMAEKKNPKALMIILLVLLLPAALSLPSAYGIFFPERQTENMRHVLNYFKTAIPKEASLVIPVNLVHLNPEVVEFHFKDQKGSVITDLQETTLEPSPVGKYFLTVELDEGSKYQEEVLDDSLYRWNAWLTEKQMNGEIKLYSTRRFGTIGVTAKVYAETSPAM